MLKEKITIDVLARMINDGFKEAQRERENIRRELTEEIQGIKNEIQGIKNEIQGIKTRLDIIEKRLDTLESGQEAIRLELKSIRNDLKNYVTKEEFIKIVKRVETLEAILKS